MTGSEGTNQGPGQVNQGGRKPNFFFGLDAEGYHLEASLWGRVNEPPGSHPPADQALSDGVRMDNPKPQTVNSPKTGRKSDKTGVQGSISGRNGATGTPSEHLARPLRASKQGPEAERKDGGDSPPSSPHCSSYRPETVQGTAGAWSARQASAAGLERRYYPAFLRDLVDYDYDEQLPDEARRWLAAFTEEHYRGWKLKSERQVHPVEMLRAAGAEKERLRRRAKDSSGSSTSSMQALTEGAGDSVALDILAGRMGLGAGELRGRNFTEDALVEALDAHRLVGQVVERAAAMVSPALVHPQVRARIRARVARPPPRLESTMPDESEGTAPPLTEEPKPPPLTPAGYLWITLGIRGWHVAKEKVQSVSRNKQHTICGEPFFRKGEEPDVTWLKAGEVPPDADRVCHDCDNAIFLGLTGAGYEEPEAAKKPNAPRKKKVEEPAPESEWFKKAKRLAQPPKKKVPEQPMLKGLKVPKDKKPEPCTVPGCSPERSDKQFCTHHKFLSTAEKNSIIARNKRLVAEDKLGKPAPRPKKKAPCGHMVATGGWCRCPAAKSLREGHTSPDADRSELTDVGFKQPAPSESELERAVRLVREFRELSPELLTVVRKELAA